MYAVLFALLIMVNFSMIYHECTPYSLYLTYDGCMPYSASYIYNE